MQRAKEGGTEELMWEMKNGLGKGEKRGSRSMVDGVGEGDESDMYAGAIDAPAKGKKGVEESGRRETTFRWTGTGKSEMDSRDEITWEPTPTNERNPKRRKVGNENLAGDGESQRGVYFYWIPRI